MKRGRQKWLWQSGTMKLKMLKWALNIRAWGKRTQCISCFYSLHRTEACKEIIRRDLGGISRGTIVKAIYLRSRGDSVAIWDGCGWLNAIQYITADVIDI